MRIHDSVVLRYNAIDLQPGKSYKMQCSASNGIGSSPWSELSALGSSRKGRPAPLEIRDTEVRS